MLEGLLITTEAADCGGKVGRTYEVIESTSFRPVLRVIPQLSQMVCLGVSSVQ